MYTVQRNTHTHTHACARTHTHTRTHTCFAVLSHFSCVQLCATIWTAAFQAPLWDSLGKSSPPGALLDPGIKLAVPAPPALQVDSLPQSHQGMCVILLPYAIQFVKQEKSDANHF